MRNIAPRLQPEFGRKITIRVLLPVFLVSAMIPLTALAEPVTQASKQAHCERVIIEHPDGTVITKENCTYYPDGTV